MADGNSEAVVDCMSVYAHNRQLRGGHHTWVNETLRHRPVTELFKQYATGKLELNDSGSEAAFRKLNQFIDSMSYF